MKSRTLILLWLIALALGACVFYLKQSEGKNEGNATTRVPGQTLLPEFPAEKVATIEIAGAEGKVTLTEKGEEWTVAERDNYPANTRNINDLLRSLSELKVTQGIEAGPSFAPRFGMDEKSSDPAEHGITATFKDSAGKQISKVSFGKNLDAASSSSPFGGGATGRYVHNHADKSGFYAVSEVFGILSPDPKSWLADDFLKIEKIESISLTEPGSDKAEWTLTRPDEAAEFAFTDAFPGVKINPSAVAPLKSLFSFARFDDVVPASEVEKRATPDQLQKAIIKTFEGFTYELTLQPAESTQDAKEGEAPPASENYLMTVSVSATLPKERKKPAEETNEEAEAADEAFKSRLETLSTLLAETKALEGRTYEVTKFTADALLKSRTDLMDKGPGPEGAGPGANTPPPFPGASAFTPPIEIPAQPTPEVTEQPDEKPISKAPQPAPEATEPPEEQPEEQEIPKAPEPELPVEE